MSSHTSQQPNQTLANSLPSMHIRSIHPSVGASARAPQSQPQRASVGIGIGEILPRSVGGPGSRGAPHGRALLAWLVGGHRGQGRWFPEPGGGLEERNERRLGGGMWGRVRETAADEKARGQRSLLVMWVAWWKDWI
jgi:hypothetical protein